MPDFKHLFSTLAIAYGFTTGFVFTVTLAALGHGWWSLLAWPATVLLLWVPMRLLER